MKLMRLKLRWWGKMLFNTSIYLEFYGAGGGIRTRDPNLGKVVLYQLSYTRIWMRRIRALSGPCKYNKVVFSCQQKSIRSASVSLDDVERLW